MHRVMTDETTTDKHSHKADKCQEDYCNRLTVLQFKSTRDEFTHIIPPSQSNLIFCFNVNPNNGIFFALK